MHNLGGVQTDAPNATPGFHCTDESDEMCYDDDGSGAGRHAQRLRRPRRHAARLQPRRLLLRRHAAGRATTSRPIGTPRSRRSCSPRPWCLPTRRHPATPTGVAAAPGPGQVTLSWTRGTEADLAGYRVLRDGVQIAALGIVTSYVDSGLLSTRSYSYELKAVDASGNVSSASAPVSATPQPTTASEQINGSFKRGSLSATVTRTAQPGPLRGVATGTAKGKTANVTVTLKNAQGTVLGTKTGASVDVQAVAAAAGAYSWTISGANGVSYKLTISYTTA